MVGQVVEEIKLEHYCIGASTPGAMHSNVVVPEHIIEMTGWLDGNDTEMQRTKEDV